MAKNLIHLVPALRASIIALLAFVLAANLVWFLNYHGFSYLSSGYPIFLIVVSCTATLPFAAAACIAVWISPIKKFILTSIALIYGIASGSLVSYSIACMDA